MHSTRKTISPRRRGGAGGAHRLHAFFAVLTAFLYLAGSSCASEPDDSAFDPSGASFDTLFFHAQRLGTTQERKDNRTAARLELERRGAESLNYLMEHIHIDNAAFSMISDGLVKKLPAEATAPVLVTHLRSEHEDTRKFAAFFLGFIDTPQYAEAVRPLLSDDHCAGAVIRTLGKWKIHEAVPDMLPFLRDEKERRRTVTANALRDMADARAVPELIAALDDPYFTVRKASAHALVAIGEAAETLLLKSIPSASRTALREIVAVLSASQSPQAATALGTLVEHADPLIRAEAARALEKADMPSQH